MTLFLSDDQGEETEAYSSALCTILMLLQLRLFGLVGRVAKNFYSILFDQSYFLGRILLGIIFILFYSISLIFLGRVLLGLCQWSLTSFISRIPFHFESCSDYKCQWPIKEGHLSLSKYENQFFRESFHTSIWMNIFKTRVVHISLTEYTQGEIWLLNPGGRPLVPYSIEFVFEEGGSISRTVFVMPQSISFSSY